MFIQCKHFVTKPSRGEFTDMSAPVSPTSQQVFAGCCLKTQNQHYPPPTREVKAEQTLPSRQLRSDEWRTGGKVITIKSGQTPFSGR